MRMPPEELARRFAEADRALAVLRRATEDLRTYGALLLSRQRKGDRYRGPDRSGLRGDPRR